MSFISAPSAERKILSILKVLSGLQKPAGSALISKHLKDRGIELSERTIRYHLRLTDERGFTQLVRERDGRVVTERGLLEIQRALVKDKMGLSISRIEQLAFRTSIDLENRSGMVPVNISIFSQDKFRDALETMANVFDQGLCVSNLILLASGGEKIGDVLIPKGSCGLASVCSIVINGALLKAGIPMDSKFGGILQLRKHQPVRFTEMIHYNGTSLDPSEIFIKARMTSVREAAASGEGEILANFREIPAICQPIADSVFSQLRQAGFTGLLLEGKTSETVCEVNVEQGKIGIILLGGLNPAAAAVEAGIETENHSMSTVVSYDQLKPFAEVVNQTRKSVSLP